MVNYEQYIQYAQYIVYLAIPALGFYILYLRNKVKLSVGWNFVNSFSKTKMSNDDLILRIKSNSGKEYYQTVKQEPIIKYKYKENKKEVEKYVIFDPKAVDNLNGMPVLNVSPSDIRPLDRDLGTLVNIPSEVVNYLVTNSTKDPKLESEKGKYDKFLIYCLGACFVALIIGLSYINQTNTELQQELMRCTLEMGKSATITPSN